MWIIWFQILLSILKLRRYTVVQSRYAFVLHTTNPQTNDADEIYGEVVCGMGEALVGNFAAGAFTRSR
jgi:hypothetical protein